MYESSGSLKTLDTDTLQPPVSRMDKAIDVNAFVRRLVDNDYKRSYKRSRLNGLVDGRPPYSATKLRENGMASHPNVNWGRARNYLESATGAFYDLFNEAPSYMTVETSFGTAEQRESWNNILSSEVDRALKSSPVFDYEMSLSIDNMVLHGCGPMLFENNDRCLPKAFLCGDLKVPEFTKSDTFYWDACMIQATYYPPELYEFIANEEAAKATGWDVEHTRKVIANAIGIRNEAGILYEWEFYEAEIKNNSLSYYDESKICRLAHVFWKEFDQRITHVIVERDYASGTEIKYLYRNIGRYAEFSNAIHPMYLDHGNGGYHHSVTGLGVKMYGAMEFENRLICNLAAKAFSPKMLFKPTSSDATQKIQMARFGEYGVLPKGTDVLQVPVSGIVADGIEMYELTSALNADVLSAYKQAPTQKTGNPVTKFEKMMQAALQSALSKTQFNRYYGQLDMLYREIYRRLTNLNSRCEVAMEFQHRCHDQGVPKEAMVRVDRLQATRVPGQGNGFMRKIAIDSIFQIAATLPEDGRNNLVRDKIAAEAGQSAVDRYFPQKGSAMPTTQEVDAQTEVAKMKIGMPTKIASEQDPVTFAVTFIQAAQQAIQSLQQGASPFDVYHFLQLDGPAIGGQLQRFANDPTRKGIHDQLSKQLEMIAKTSDQLHKQLQEMVKKQQQQKQKQGQAMNDAQLKQAKLQADIALKKQKQDAMLQQRAQKHAQDLSLSDMETAHSLAINRIKALSE